MKVRYIVRLILAYQNSRTAQELAAQAIFGGIALKGKLPVSTHHYKLNSGETSRAFRMKYTNAKEVNINENLLYKVDSLVGNAIAKKATPGCQVLIAKNGKALDIAGGEGRNSVFAASKGYEVTCLDISEHGLQKAQALVNF